MHVRVVGNAACDSGGVTQARVVQKLLLYLIPELVSHAAISARHEDPNICPNGWYLIFAATWHFP